MKKIVIISAIVSMVAGGIFICDFLLKLGIFDFLIKPLMRDIILFLLLTSVLIWTIFINRKTRKPINREIGEIKATADNMKRYNNELRDTANRMVSINEELRNSVDNALIENKKLKDENKSIKVLMETVRTKINEKMDKAISEARNEMRRDIEKALEASKSKNQPESSEELHLNDEHFFILEILGNVKEAVEKENMFSSYSEQFQKDRVYFKFIWEELSNHGLIELAYQNGFDTGKSFFTLTKKGLDTLKAHLYKDEKKIKKKELS